jgi:MazG family protein
MPPAHDPRDINALVAVMAALRTPVTGCPWDLEQSFATIAPYTVEEAYEVADAIARNDLTNLKEELGDLLLQVVYHARMAEEIRAFAFADVVDGIVTKMIRRHPHVFGDEAARSAGAAKGFWDKAKAAEKTARGDVATSRLNGIPVALPALTRAVKLQHKAAKAGFDWPSLAPVFDKLKEELAELETEIARAGSGDREAITEEFGDLMFVMANVARHLEIDPEHALRAANQKFTRRFQHIERTFAAEGRDLETATLADLDAVWDDAKRLERGHPPDAT